MTCITFHPSNPSLLFSAAEDGARRPASAAAARHHSPPPLSPAMSVHLNWHMRRQQVSSTYTILTKGRSVKTACRAVCSRGCGVRTHSLRSFSCRAASVSLRVLRPESNSSLASPAIRLPAWLQSAFLYCLTTVETLSLWDVSGANRISNFDSQYELASA